MGEVLSGVPRSSMQNERRWSPSKLGSESLRGGKRVSGRGYSIKSRTEEEVMESSSAIEPCLARPNPATQTKPKQEGAMLLICDMKTEFERQDVTVHLSAGIHHSLASASSGLGL